ncbi:730_t:CDS:2 [Ambispora gerdemannii]|uniref:730_t:CDS:1 n=1 Tax=Ambispora gerdemannii TaxID=144530 RepID=A0A9N9AUS3_9GLOM|nr:730_t:CDS:2 [Ambispora gerdemannii]
MVDAICMNSLNLRGIVLVGLYTPNAIPLLETCKNLEHISINTLSLPNLFDMLKESLPPTLYSLEILCPYSGISFDSNSNKNFFDFLTANQNHLKILSIHDLDFVNDLVDIASDCYGKPRLFRIIFRDLNNDVVMFTEVYQAYHRTETVFSYWNRRAVMNRAKHGLGEHFSGHGLLLIYFNPLTCMKVASKY